MSIDNISVVMIAKDAEKSIKKSLDSLKAFDEVIVYINNSSDNTELIASTYPNVKVIDGEFIGFGETKNIASSYASNDWILSLDSDEVLSDNFIANLSRKTLNTKSLYSILRSNYYKDKEIKYCWGGDEIVRLYNKRETSFNKNKVHEFIIEDGLKLEKIDGEVQHFPYNNLSDFIIKLDRYSTEFAQDNAGKKESSPLKAILNSQYSFIKTYIFKRGFLDGYAGLVIAFSHTATNFYKYMKLYEANEELKKEETERRRDKRMTILITRHDKIGDFITALPMCRVLKTQTRHKIVMLVSKINVPLARECEFIDEVIEYRDDTKSLLKEIKSYSFTVSISAFIDNSMGKILFRSGIPIRIAPATKIAQIFFNRRVKQRRSLVEKREWEYNLDLLKAFDKNLQLEFKRPLLDFDLPRENRILFHVGSGGSSDGNLRLDDYLRLASKVTEFCRVVFTFGKDDSEAKSYIEKNLHSDAHIRDNFGTIKEFTEFISQSRLFVSTSTGPMHLAGVTNTPTLSFFGSSLFASSARWGTISDESLQNNFEIESNYDRITYQKIEDRLMELIK